MAPQLKAQHTEQDGQLLTALRGLPGPDEYLTREDLLSIARQIHEKAIDAQRLASEPPRHELTPSYLKYPDPPTFDESCDMHPSMLRGSHD